MLNFISIAKILDSQMDLNDRDKAALTNTIINEEPLMSDEIINKVLYKVITECDDEDDAMSFLNHIISELTNARNSLK